VALLVIADQLTAVSLRDLLDEERRAAVGALFGNGFVPQREIAVGIIRAAVEYLAAARFPLDDVPAVLRTQNAGRLLLHEPARRIVRARGELAEAPLLDDEIRPALGTQLVDNLIRLCRGNALFGRNDLPRRLALGIPGARQELAEPPPLDHHRLAAVVAGLFDLSFGTRFR